jgi:TMEM175 potassium channel family protein
VEGDRSLLARDMRFTRDDAEFDRAIGFIDATYALALTLLVTTLDVGDAAKAFADPGSLFDAVGAQFIAFLIAFAVISNYWLVHHRMVAAWTAIDTPTIVANLVLVCAIVLLPFSTQSVGDPGVQSLALPTVIMALNVAAASILHGWVFWLGARRGLLSESRPKAEIRGYLTLGLIPAAVFLISIPVAVLAGPETARAVWLTLVVIEPVSHRLVSNWVARAQTAGE